MNTQHNKNEIVETLSKAQFGAVATFDGTKIRTRMMHFAADNDLNLYFATMKGDPKVYQIVKNSNFSFITNYDNGNMLELKEVEVIGKAKIIHNNEERNKILLMLTEKSPIVKNLYDSHNTDILEVIKVTPSLVKYRVFGEIVRGVSPTIIQFDKTMTEDNYNWEKWGLDFLPQKVKLYIEELRAPFFTASIIPVLLGSIIAAITKGTFNWFYFWLTLIGGILLHAGTNVANDYFDHKSKNDEVNREFIRPFSGGSRLIQKGLLKPKEVLMESLICFVIGSAIGLYLAYTRGYEILLLGLIGVVSGFFYTAPPFRWGYRGIGELIVGLNFGILMCLGAYFVQTQSISFIPIVAAIPVSLLIAAVLYINEFPDYKADKEVGKNHLVVRLDRKKAVTGYQIIMILVYISILMGILTNIIPAIAALSFLTIPLAKKAIITLKRFHSESWKLFPANLATVKLHLYIGLILTISYLINQ